MKCSFGISNFPEEISSLSHSIVFFYFFALITEEGFLISPCYSLKLCIQMGISFLSSFAFSSLLFTAILRPPQTTILSFCISFSWGWSWSLPPVQCHKPLSIALQALCLCDLIPSIYFSLPLYNHKVFKSYLNGLVVFPTFFNFKSEFHKKEFMIWAIVSSWSFFCCLYGASPSLAAKSTINLISVLTFWWCRCVESFVLLEESICYNQCVLLAKL